MHIYTHMYFEEVLLESSLKRGYVMEEYVLAYKNSVNHVTLASNRLILES